LKGLTRISFVVNGKREVLEIRADKRLLDILREDLNLTGTKEGCSKGECGACTVLLDGEAVCSCLVVATQVDGKSVLTIEGLQRNGQLHPIQKAFIEEGAVQCGFCTPGLIMATAALLNKKKHPTKKEIKEALSGNLCRCTGYSKITKAVEKASRR
jgi:carbon-monoxide dehydrogenase small subunit